MEIPDINDITESNDITDPNDRLVATIVIQMHGTVITYELGPTEGTLFENVRLLCKAGGLNPYYQVALDVVDDLRKIFGKDLDNSTYDIIKKAKRGVLLETVTFDKTLSTRGRTWNPLEQLNGIYLLSIHRGRNLIYPMDPREKVINFLNVDDLHRLESMFPISPKDKIPFPILEDDASPFPNQSIYVEEEARVREDPDKTQKIKKIRAQFMKLLDNWKLTLDSSGNIEIIKLSYLVRLIKSILGKKIIINLLDYSCNSPSAYIPEESQLSSKYIFQDVGNDYDAMERGLMGQRVYGGRKRMNNKKKTIRRKTIRRKMRCRSKTNKRTKLCINKKTIKK